MGRSVSVKNMVINVLASLFDTPGDMPPNDPPLNHQMMLVHVNVNSSSVIFSSSRTLLPKDVYNEDYHAFYSSIGFDHEDESFCSAGGNTPVEHQCCGGIDAPWYWISVNNNKCCNQSPTSSGIVVGANDEC